MKVLFISEQFPYPLHDGGNLRTYHLLRGLAAEHDVTLLAHAPREKCDPDSLGRLYRLVTVRRTSKLLRLGRNVLRFGATKPLFLLKNRSARLLAEADRLLNTETFDVIHFNHLDCACFALERKWPQTLIFDSHNCLSELATRAQQTASKRLDKAILAREVKLLQSYEKAVCDRMSITLVCSDLEQKSFKQLWPSGNFETIPNGVDTGYFRPVSGSHEESGAVVFTGAMGYWPNERAAIYFCTEVLPVLRRMRPDVRVYFVGKQPTARVQALHDGQSIFVTGQVDDVRPYLQRAQVVIVPLRHGAGTRLKILEAFAMEKAVVSTSIGAEGIAAADGNEILLADDPADFAAKVAYLMQESTVRLRLGSAALALARRVYDWKSIQQRILCTYNRVRSNAAYSLSA
jgi:sugar transferase (PEP-CTERM/EpsH1 system associated)